MFGLASITLLLFDSGDSGIEFSKLRVLVVELHRLTGDLRGYRPAGDDERGGEDRPDARDPFLDAVRVAVVHARRRSLANLLQEIAQHRGQRAAFVLTDVIILGASIIAVHRHPDLLEVLPDAIEDELQPRIGAIRYGFLWCAHLRPHYSSVNFSGR